MGKLNVLGAQRVKALTEILNEKKQQEIADLKTATDREITQMVDEEFNVEKKRKAFNTAYKRAQKLLEELTDVTGSSETIKIDRYYMRTKDTDYKERISELKDELISQPVAEVKAKYKRKEQQLWLCETLEEAKEIVGL